MSVQPTPDGGSYRHQDGQVLTLQSQDNKPHAQWRWELRAPPKWRNLSVRVAWREAEPVAYPSCNSDAEYARLHVATEIVLIAHYGMLRTVVRLSDRPEHEQQYVREQVRERGESDE